MLGELGHSKHFCVPTSIISIDANALSFSALRGGSGIELDCSKTRIVQMLTRE